MRAGLRVLRLFKLTIEVIMATQRRNTPVSKSEDTEILDSDEQEKIISELEKESELYMNRFRKLFTLVFAMCSVLFICGCLHFYWYPWSLVHELYFEGVVSEGFVYAYYIQSSFISLVAAVICHVSRLRAHMCYYSVLVFPILTTVLYFYRRAVSS